MATKTQMLLTFIAGATVIAVLLAAQLVSAPTAGAPEQNGNTPRANTYENETLGLSFSYPADWHEGNNNRARFFQLYNYDVSEATGGHNWPEGHNKIEAAVTPQNTYGTSSDFPEESRDEAATTVAGRETMRTDVLLTGGNRIRTYAIPLHNAADEFLSVSIYGDPDNFHVLDEAMNTLEFE